jgi:DNA-binding beta-propeller fold protein YncE
MILGRFRTSSDVKSALAEPNTLHGPRGLRDGDVLRFNRPTDIAFAPSGEFYVSDGYGNSRVVRFAKDGRLLGTWGKRGAGPGEFHTPHAVAVDARGRVFVADRENYRIQIFDGAGKFEREWTHVGAPWGLDWTREGHLLVADGYNNRLLELDPGGKVLGAFGVPGKLPGEFSYLHHLAAGPDGSIYTAEILNWRPQKLVRK